MHPDQVRAPCPVMEGTPSEDEAAATSSTPGAGEASRGNNVLTEREADILAFEREWWKYPGAKEAAIRERFDMSATRYYQALNALIDRPAALAAEPLLVTRLHRLREQRRRRRVAGRLGDER